MAAAAGFLSELGCFFRVMDLLSFCSVSFYEWRFAHGYFYGYFCVLAQKNNRCSSNSIFGAISDFARCPCPCEDSTNSIKGTEAAFSPFRRLIMVHNSFEGTSIVRLQLYVHPPPFILHYTSSPAGSAYHDNSPTLSTLSSTALTPPVPFSNSPSPSGPQTPQRRYNST